MDRVPSGNVTRDTYHISFMLTARRRVRERERGGEVGERLDDACYIPNVYMYECSRVCSSSIVKKINACFPTPFLSHSTPCRKDLTVERLSERSTRGWLPH
uniref:Uncharacterized protein n=1 Tax=Lotharella globosa TaxID=91324 RepID=A0A6V3NZ41_9EUKA